jgi:hypothetical protein
MDLIRPAVKAPAVMPSIYGNKYEKRVYEVPGMCSVKLSELFPKMTKAVYEYGDDVSIIAKRTREQLANVNMDMIKPEHTVNINCAEHGFAIMHGDAYLQMLKTIKEVVEERTGNRNIRLRVVMYRTPNEGREVIEHYNLRELFDNKLEHTCAFDKGVPIETQVGTLWGIEKAYDADWFIFAYYDDPREIYFHRLYRKGLKAFTMNFARYETRSAFHLNFGHGSGVSQQIIPISIFESDFVQSKYAFSCFMRTAPSGIHGIDADNDLFAIDDRSEILCLKDYPMIFHLLTNLSAWTAVWDVGRWPYYMHAGGLCFGVIETGTFDPFDLDGPSMAIGDERIKYEGGPCVRGMDIPDGLKAVVSNIAWCGIQEFHVPMSVPTYMVGKEQQELFRNDPNNRPWMDFAHPVDTLEEGLEAARKVVGNDKLVVFDGSFGYINCSRSMAEELIERAPGVEEMVMNKYYPLYLKQRGIDPDKVLKK